MGTRPNLKVVGGTGFKELALREKFINDLIKDAARLYPATGDAETDKRLQATREKWIAARMHLSKIDAKPRVRMDSTAAPMFPRTMREAGRPWFGTLPTMFRALFRS